MKRTITLKDIQNSACASRNPHLFGQHAKEKGKSKGKKLRTYTIGGRRVVKHFPKGSEEKNWIDIILIQWSQKHCLELYEEYIFVTDRGWRFDYLLLPIKVAIEYEGIISDKSRHTTVKGYTGDSDKYRRALIEGFKVLRYTALNYKSILEDLNQLLVK